jgi:hypothetical protein
VGVNFRAGGKKSSRLPPIPKARGRSWPVLIGLRRPSVRVGYRFWDFHVMCERSSSYRNARGASPSQVKFFLAVESQMNKSLSPFILPHFNSIMNINVNISKC